MSAASTNQSGGYTVSVDSKDAQAVDGYLSGQSATCGVTWSALGLSDGQHVVFVNLTGQSHSAQNVAASAFELDGFTYEANKNNNWHYIDSFYAAV